MLSLANGWNNSQSEEEETDEYPFPLALRVKTKSEDGQLPHSPDRVAAPNGS
jgi:glycogen(starch) synthase